MKIMIDWGYWPNAESITAYSTLILAFATGLLVFVTWKYVGEIRSQAGNMREQADAMKRQATAMESQSTFVKDQTNAMTSQAKTMEDQFGIIREESATMRRQADAMEGQSSLIREQATILSDQASAMKKQADIMEQQSKAMLENIRYDHILKKYERANMEMSLLIGPLYARRNDPNIFSFNKRKERVKMIQKVRYAVIDESIMDFVSFWDSIDQNIYLNRSDYFEKSFRNYNSIIDEYFMLEGQNKQPSEISHLKESFDKELRPQLIKSIEERYVELSNEICSIRLELEAQENRIK